MTEHGMRTLFAEGIPEPPPELASAPVAAIRHRIRRRRLRTWIGSLTGMVMAALSVTVVLATSGAGPVAPPWMPYSANRWVLVVVDPDGRGMTLYGWAAPGCSRKPTAVPAVREAAERVTITLPPRDCAYILPFRTSAPLGGRMVVTSDGYRLPVLSKTLVPQPTYPAGIAGDLVMNGFRDGATRPTYWTEYVDRADGFAVHIGVTLDDGHATPVPAGRHLTVRGHDVTIVPGGGAVWVDHGWIVTVDANPASELVRVLNGLVWPT